MSKIQLTDTTKDIIIKMSEGNPGAISALMEIMNHHKEIDPQDALGLIGPILSLDSYKIYGSSIYILWSDICNRNIRRMIMLIRATDLGFFDANRLANMANDQNRSNLLSEEELNELDKKVCNKLTKFKTEEL